MRAKRAKPQPPQEAVNRRRLHDVEYRRIRALEALGRLDQWCADYMVLQEVRPVVEAIRDRYDVLVKERVS